MFNKRVIVLCGRAQSGKSTAASMLVGLVGEELVARRSFADPIKEMLWKMCGGLGMEPRHLYGTNEDKNKKLEVLGWNTPRYAMQTLGTEWRELLAKNLWVRHLHMRIDHASANCVVVDDMRFQHEYEHFRDAGALIIGIERPEQGTSNSTHASETWDFRTTGMPVIMNDGSIEDLKAKLLLYI